MTFLTLTDDQWMSDDFLEYWWTSDEYREQREEYKNLPDTRSSALKIAIGEYIKKLSCEGCVNELYSEEIEALSKLEVDGIITTNWDLYLEKLFPDYKVFVGQRDLFLSNPLVVHFYQVDVLKDLNVSRSLNFHFDSIIPASLAGVFLHLTFLPSWYVNPACSLQKLKCVQ